MPYVSEPCAGGDWYADNPYSLDPSRPDSPVFGYCAMPHCQKRLKLRFSKKHRRFFTPKHKCRRWRDTDFENI